MKPVGRNRVVIVTCANRHEARRIAQAVVGKRLAACANIFNASVYSVYRWKGKVETAREIIMFLKTTTKRLPQLEREVRRLHSYNVPEFIVLPIVAGSSGYLRWIEEGTR